MSGRSAGNPVAWTATFMCNGQHPDRLASDDEREVKGKGFQIDTALIGGAEAIRFGMVAQALDRALQFIAESPPQARLRLFVIEDGIQKLLPGLMHEPDRHRARSLSAAAMTSSKGMPDSRP